MCREVRSGYSREESGGSTSKKNEGTMALRLPCYSCMSPYLEDHYPYISHLYRKPLAFDVHCDKHSLDTSYLYSKNCSDMCVTLRINDVVGGNLRF
ncbi:hypothetical protein B9Z55_019990 [Caenorhabditis nigoni]|uniref:Uncharacterized protein n=1 Tax=Caenorhabditis nigoni TaxID=1611254 RepID=A0A2G5TKR0_9PELO|nr:hypothetical protein B9Z55_019990 [Caenorhabditis nigoni]